MTDAPPLPPISAPQYKDRRTGLIIFGILQIGLGALAGLMVPLMVFGQVMAAQTTNQPVAFRQMVQGMVFYTVVAVMLIILGIGSCKARRWARALSLIVSWSWLIIGVVTAVMLGFFLPQILKSATPPNAQASSQSIMVAVMLFTMLFMGILFVAVPGVLLFFYRSPHVKATCETLNPAPVWTDACPLPVLGLSLWLAFGALTMLSMPLSTNGVLPAFGTILSGLTGSVFCLALAALWGYCALATYRLQPAAWWIVLVSVCVMSLSALVTFTRIDLMEMYRLMGYSEQQLQPMKQLNLLAGPQLAYFSMAGAVPIFAYLLWVKRFFRGAKVGLQRGE